VKYENVGTVQYPVPQEPIDIDMKPTGQIQGRCWYETAGCRVRALPVPAHTRVVLLYSERTVQRNNGFFLWYVYNTFNTYRIPRFLRGKKANDRPLW
jgi:hypothetical protein